jgi:VCBS repeat-containing protein
MKCSDNHEPQFEPFEARLLMSGGPVVDLAPVVRPVLAAVAPRGYVDMLMLATWRGAAPLGSHNGPADSLWKFGTRHADADAVTLRPSGSVLIYGTLARAGDADVFAVIAPKSGKVGITLDTRGWANRRAAEVSVYDASGNVVLGIAQTTNGTATLRVDAVAGQTLYVKVAGVSGARGRYVLGLTLTPVNQAPTAANDDYRVDEDGVLTASVGVLANDTDVDQDPMTALLVSGTSHGSLALNPDGTFAYTPDANFNGTDSFTYKANDGKADSADAVVSITVRPVNDAPVAQADAYEMTVNGTLAPTTSLLAAAADVDGDRLTALLASGPTHGTVDLNADGTFVYTPEADFTGTDTFAYKANDGQADSEIATITITVNPANDPPVAQDDGYSIDHDGVLVESLGILANDTDPNGDLLTALLVAGPANGTLTLNPDGTFTYTPNAGWFGTDVFTYMANDGQADSNVAQVMIQVVPANQAPVAYDDVYTVKQNMTLSVSAKAGILANDTDAEGDWLFAMLVGRGTSNGRLYLESTGALLYVPNPGFTGIDVFTYQATDAYGFSNIATVTILVVA